MNEPEPVLADEPRSGIEPAASDTATTTEQSLDDSDAPRTTRPRRRTLREALAALTAGRRPRLLAGIAVAVVVTVTAGTLFSNQPASRPAGLAPSSSSRPGQTPAASTVALPAEPLAADDAHPVAALTANHAAGSVVQLDSRFRLTSADGTPASTLAARLTVTPNTALTATTEPGDQAVTLTPRDPLTPGVVYRFALAGAAGELVDTWAFQARQPLHVVSTVPDNQQSDVPLDTGIEVTFDQDGVDDVASHVTIDPATPGRFETHGRTVAFVPNRPLVPKTVYAITVTKGVAVADTGEQTEADTRFTFETTAAGDQPRESGLGFPDEENESGTADRPVIGVWLFGDPDHPVKKASLSVYRFSGMTAAVDAWRSLRARPDWTRYSTRGLVDTTILRRVLAATIGVNGVDGNWWISMPERLPAGWYLVQLDGTRPAQTVLQVTDVAGYVAVSETRTVIWANDLATGHAIAGASAVANGSSLGRTDKDGLLVAATPATLLPRIGDRCDRPCDPFVTVTAPGGRSVFLPTMSSHDKLEELQIGYMWSEADQRFWALLDTDRGRYRSTDTINVWGLIKSRSDSSVPGVVTVRFKTTLDEPVDLPIATIASKPSKTGVFVASIPLVDIPNGTYSVELVAGGRTIRALNVEVGPIAKPAYQLQIGTGRRIYVAGDRIKVSVRASFFEGTPVPGVPLHIEGANGHSATTADDGTAVTRLTATPERGLEGATVRTVEVTPARAEEGEIVGATQTYYVYPGTSVVSGRASISGGSVVVNGSVHALARDRLETAVAGGAQFWDLDPNGPAIGRAVVDAQFVELVPVRVEVGSTYDFIAKKVVPNYRIDLVRQDRGTVHVRTSAAGTFRLSLPKAVAGHDYEVVLSAADADRHVWRSTVYAASDTGPQANASYPSLQLTNAQPNNANAFGVGEPVDVTMTGGAPSGSTAGSRYLFFVAHQGIRSAVVQTSPRFVTPFASWALPDLHIVAIRFEGRAYVGDVAYSARFRTDDRRLDVRLSSDAPRYRPGATATIHIRTLDASGSPIAATVVLRGVDEKLFSIGAAASDDPLAELYQSVESGILGTFASHHGPRAQGEGGDTTGGGGDDRSDFRDAILFRAVTTDSAGRGSASFKLSDDLTAWRVSATAVSGRLEAGTASLLLPVGLPFFIDASIAPEYLVGDRPSIAVRTYGSSVTPGAPVTVSLTSSTLGGSASPVATTAFSSLDLPLPALRVGLQTVTITATTGTGSSRRTDRLTRTFRVVDSRLTRSVQSLTTLSGQGASSLLSGAFAGGTGLTSVAITDAGSGAYLPLLEQLSASSGARLEQALAADVADRLLIDRFGFAAEDLAPSGFLAERYQSRETGGMTALPYAGTDLEASVLAALVGSDSVDRQQLTAYLRSVRTNPESTRERQILAAAGLAALGDPVLPELQRAAGDGTLTVRERLFVAIGLAAAGDSGTARSVASGLIASSGERLGAVARLRVGDDLADTRQATALMAVLAAMTGDARAPLFWAYVAATPIADRVESLPAIAYVKASLDRVATQPASFQYSVDGRATTISLARGEAYRLALTTDQVKALRIDRISGTIAVFAGWREAAAASDFEPDPDVSIVRNVRPETVNGASLVQVDLNVSFGAKAGTGCHDVTELLPSGLTPVGSTAAWSDSSEEGPIAAYITPYEQSATSVRFCADPASMGGRTLRYYARAITPGTYLWEPAVIDSTTEAGRASLTEGATLTIH